MLGDPIGSQPVFDVLHGDVDVLSGKFFDRLGGERDAARVVDLLPRILATHDEIGEQDAGDRTVGHALPGVAGGHEDILGAVRVASDERDVVVRLEDLA